MRRPARNFLFPSPCHSESPLVCSPPPPIFLGPRTVFSARRRWLVQLCQTPANSPPPPSSSPHPPVSVHWRPHYFFASTALGAPAFPPQNPPDSFDPLLPPASHHIPVQKFARCPFALATVA